MCSISPRPGTHRQLTDLVLAKSLFLPDTELKRLATNPRYPPAPRCAEMHPHPETPPGGLPGQGRPSKLQARPALPLPLQMTTSTSGSSGPVGRAGTSSWVAGPSCERCSHLSQVSSRASGIGWPLGQAVAPERDSRLRNKGSLLSVASRVLFLGCFLEQGPHFTCIRIDTWAKL